MQKLLIRIFCEHGLKGGFEFHRKTLAKGDPGSLVPVGAALNGLPEGERQFNCRNHPILKAERFHFEDALLAVGFGVQAAYKFTIMQDGQGEVAVLAFGCRGIALDDKIEVK